MATFLRRFAFLIAANKPNHEVAFIIKSVVALSSAKKGGNDEQRAASSLRWAIVVRLCVRSTLSLSTQKYQNIGGVKKNVRRFAFNQRSHRPSS
jgi:hypothetical protein